MDENRKSNIKIKITVNDIPIKGTIVWDGGTQTERNLDWNNDISQLPYKGNMQISWSGLLEDETYPSDGGHFVKIEVWDADGNPSDALAIPFTIDRTPPKVLEINPRENDFVNTRQPSLSVVLEETGTGLDASSLMIFIDGFQENVEFYPSEQAISCTSSRILDEGEHFWRIVCKDIGGNVLDQNYSFTVDVTRPEIIVSGVINGKSYNQNVIPIIGITDINLDGTASVIKLNNNNFISGTELPVTPGVIEGCNLNIFAKDLAGNEARKLVGFILGADTDEILNKKEFVVYELNVRFKNSMMVISKLIDKPEYKRIGAHKGDRIELSADLIPNILFKDKQYIWSGEKVGIGPTISVDFNNVGDSQEKVELGDVSKTVSIKVGEVLPPNEEEWSRANPFEFTSVYFLGKTAEEWVNSNLELLGRDIHNGKADAARHAYWNTLITTIINAEIAEGATKAHERANYEYGIEYGRKHSPYNEIIMDLENNSKGRFVGINLPENSSPEECQNAIIDMLNNGNLTVLDNIVNKYENGLLKPSDK